MGGLPALADPIEPEEIATKSTQFSVTFDGANPVEPVGLDQAETLFNYFVGGPENWHAEVPSYEVVAYAPDWAKAIGRSLFYSAVTKLSPGILFIMRSDEDLVFSNRLYTPIREHDLRIKVWLRWEDE